MKLVKLYGEMGERFGSEFQLAVDSAAEAIRALRHTVAGFDAYLREHAQDGFHVLVGEEAKDERGLFEPVGSMEVIKLVPAVAGAKDGLGQILLGAALITAAFALGPEGYALMSAGFASGVASVGWAMALGGVASLLATTPQENYNPGGTNDAENFTFGSPTLTVGQGGPVPLGYGEMVIGGVVISAGVTAETWQDKGFGGAAPDNAGTRGGDGDTSPWVWAIEP